MMEDIRRALAQVLPLRQGELELSLVAPPKLLEDGSVAAVCRCVMFGPDGSRSQSSEQSVVLLAAHAELSRRGVAAIEGLGRALPALIVRHPAVRLASGSVVFPEEFFCPELLAHTSAATPEAISAFLLGPESPFAWARRASLEPAYRPLRKGGTGDWQAELYQHLNREASGIGFEWRHVLLPRWPEVVQTAYFGVVADAMLGGGGFEVYLEQAASEDVRGIVQAFSALGARRLETLSRLAIAKLLEQGSAECISTGDVDWMAELAEDVVFPDSWSEIDHHGDGGSFTLRKSELRPLLEAHCERHRAELVTDLVTDLRSATSS